MAIRKRCKHAVGKTGAARMRAWRQCGCVWGTDLHVDGVRVWRNLGGDERAARVADAQLRLDVLQGRHAQAGETGFAALADQWLAAKEADPNARPGSIQAWRTRTRHAKNWLGDTRLQDIRQHDVNAMVQDFTRNVGPATATNVAVTVSAIIRWAARQGLDQPPVTFRGVTPAPNRTHRQAHTIEELRRVIDVLEPPFDSMAEFALLTGLRRGEILALTVDDVESTGVRVDGSLDVSGRVGPTKTGSGVRLVTLSPRAFELVRERVGVVGAGRLWPVGLRDASAALVEGMRKAGVYRRGKGWHSFRHAHTAVLNEAGVSLRDSAARLGHGANYAQSLAYGWAAEQVDADVVDATVRRHGGDRG